MTSQTTYASAPPVLELALSAGPMRSTDWLRTVRAAAEAGVQQLVLTGRSPATHPAARGLWECGTGCGMHVVVSAAPPVSPTDLAPRIRIGGDGIPRLVIPDGIPLTTPLASTDLTAFASPPVLRALGTAADWPPDTTSAA